MSDNSSDVNELARSIFEYELKAGAAADDLFGSVPQAEAEQAMMEEFKGLVNDIDDPEMLQSTVMTMAQIGRGVGSQQMVEMAEKVIQQSDQLDVQ